MHLLQNYLIIYVNNVMSVLQFYAILLSRLCYYYDRDHFSITVDSVVRNGRPVHVHCKTSKLGN